MTDRSQRGRATQARDTERASQAARSAVTDWGSAEVRCRVLPFSAFEPSTWGERSALACSSPSRAARKIHRITGSQDYIGYCKIIYEAIISYDLCIHTNQPDRPDSRTAAGDGQARPTSDVGAGEHPVRAGRATGDEQARPTGDEPHESARRSRQQSAAATRINDRLLGTPHKSDSNTATGDEQAQLTDDEPHESARRSSRSGRQSIRCGVSAGGRGWRVTVAAVVESAVFGAQERISVPRRSTAAAPGLRRC